MNDGTFIVPQTGKYRITVIGHGGTGAQGYKSESSGGGGAGGIAASILSLNKDDSIEIKCNNELSSFGDYLQATAGAEGKIGDKANKIGGDGGTASGGNLFNYDGNPGVDSKGGDTGITTLGGFSDVAGAGYFPFLNLNGVSTGGTSTQSPTFGGGAVGHNSNGYGGAGGAAFGGGGNGGTYWSEGARYPTSPGGAGGSGAVIIEYIETF